MGKTVIAAVIVILACALPVFSYGQDSQPVPSSSASPAPGTAAPGDDVIIAQGEAEELSHQALATAVQATDLFYVVSAGGTLPVLDSTFRDFVDYGAMVSFGAGKRVTEKLSITATIGVGMMTGDWSVSGDRQSILVAVEEYYPGYISGPGAGIVITPEDLPDENLGISYHGEAEAVIISAEALKSIDVHTDLYLPGCAQCTLPDQAEGHIRHVCRGGLGFCVATRGLRQQGHQGEVLFRTRLQGHPERLPDRHGTARQPGSGHEHAGLRQDQVRGRGQRDASTT